MSNKLFRRMRDADRFQVAKAACEEGRVRVFKQEIEEAFGVELIENHWAVGVQFLIVRGSKITGCCFLEAINAPIIGPVPYLFSAEKFDRGASFHGRYGIEGEEKPCAFTIFLWAHDGKFFYTYNHKKRFALALDETEAGREVYVEIPHQEWRRFHVRDRPGQA